MIRDSRTANAIVLLAGAGLAACAGDPAAAKTRDTSNAAVTSKAPARSVDLGNRPYRVATLTAFGSVHGTIKASGRLPTDSSAVAGQLCSGKPIPSSSLPRGALPVVVWISDVPVGKPLPIEKRAELSSDDCVLDPPVQAAVVGTTFNVFNDDKDIHRLVFTRAGTLDTLTVMPFFNSGQVVATERLARVPGVVDVQCTRHPWMHGYIAVFDHPYFAVTDEKGAFTIDSLPPGKHTLLAWHEGMASPASHVVQVAANGTASVDLTLP